MGKTKQKRNLTLEKLRVIFSKDRLRIFFSKLAIGLLIPSIGTIIGTIIILKYGMYFSEPTITHTFSKYITNGATIYYGELINESSAHAKEFTLKGKFNSDIKVFELDMGCIVEKKEINKPPGSIELFLKRLSNANKCGFTIIVEPDAEIVGNFQASWGEKGTLSLDLQEANDGIIKGLELSDLSRKARQKWFENNTKNIRK